MSLVFFEFYQVEKGWNFLAAALAVVFWADIGLRALRGVLS